MLVVLLLLVLLSAFITALNFGAMFGPGQWIVENIMQCDDADQYSLKLDLSRKKLNRSTDCFTLSIKFDEEFDGRYGIELHVYKEMDGGYKYYQFVQDESACNFINKFAKVNFEKILTLAGADPPNCPLPPGEYTAKDYIFNYDELTDPFPYGSFEIVTHLLLNEERVTCVKIYTRFEDHIINDADEDK